MERLKRIITGALDMYGKAILEGRIPGIPERHSIAPRLPNPIIKEREGEQEETTSPQKERNKGS